MMNERIKELARQAGYLEDCFGFGHWDMPECKKFAELIIQECADYIRANLDSWDAEPLAFCMERDFGVHGDYA